MQGQPAVPDLSPLAQSPSSLPPLAAAVPTPEVAGAYMHGNHNPSKPDLQRAPNGHVLTASAGQAAAHVPIKQQAIALSPLQQEAATQLVASMQPRDPREPRMDARITSGIDLRRYEAQAAQAAMARASQPVPAAVADFRVPAGSRSPKPPTTAAAPCPPLPSPHATPPFPGAVPCLPSAAKVAPQRHPGGVSAAVHASGMAAAAAAVAGTPAASPPTNPSGPSPGRLPALAGAAFGNQRAGGGDEAAPKRKRQKGRVDVPLPVGRGRGGPPQPHNTGASSQGHNSGGSGGNVAGYLAPGPATPAMAPGSSPGSQSTWPVLPYFEEVEYALANADTHPLTFHRQVTRPLALFLSAVMQSLSIKDRTVAGLGMFLMRAMVKDSVHGRLAIYDALVKQAARGDWQNFIVGALEYMESAGFDTSKLFQMWQQDSPGDAAAE